MNPPTQDDTHEPPRPEVKIFVSSPGDVNEERVLANRILSRLADRYAPVARIVPIIWEHEPLLASGTFQDQIEKPSATDIVVCILWSRLGTRLPGHITRDDGSRYDSGTEFEFEDAFRALQASGRPDLLVYRKMSEPLISLADASEAEERLRQKRALDGFIQKWFHDQDGSLLAAFHSFGNAAEFEEAFEMHLDKLVQRRLSDLGVDLLADAARQAAAAPVVPQWEGSPFRGLDTFEFEHAPIFYGRTRAVSEVLDSLRRQAADGQAFVLVLGRSGGGKSSLVRAGVMPLLVEPGVVEGVGLWRRAIFRPSEASGDLFDAFAAAITSDDALPELLSDGTSRAELAALLRDNPPGVAPLIKGALSQAAQAAAYEQSDTVMAALGDDAAPDARAAARDEILSNPPQARLALLVDQLEELFSDNAVTDDTRRRFLQAMAALARSGRVYVVATLRSDFYAQAMEYPDLADLKGGHGQYDLAPPTSAEIGQVIRMPALRAGLRFEENPDTGARLDDTLRDVAAAEPDSLPLLEFTLEELFHARDPDGLLTWSAYDALGGVAGALGRRAEEVFLGLGRDAQTALPNVMRRLVHVGLGRTHIVTKRPARMEAFAPGGPGRAFVDAFVASRLFVVGTADDGAPIVALAHEALLHSWPRLEEWLQKDLDLLRVRSRVAYAAERWQEAGNDAQMLLPSGRALDEATMLAGNGGFDLSRAEQDFISRSTQKARRNRHLKQGAVLALGLLAVLASSAAWFANDQRRAAAASESLAIDARERADAARERAVTSAEEARLAEALAKEAQIAADHNAAVAETARARAEASETDARARLNELFVERGRQAMLEGRPEEATLTLGAAYLASGDVLTGALYSSARDLAAIRQRSIQAHGDLVSVSAIGPGGIAATASSDGTIAVRSMADGRLLGQTRMAGASIHALAFRPGGQSLAAAGDSGEILLWDFGSGRSQTLQGHEQTVTDLGFSQDGTRLISVSFDNTSRLWTLDGEISSHALIEPTSSPLDAGFLAGGDLVITARDGSVGRWNAASGAQMERFQTTDGDGLRAARLLPGRGVLVVATSSGEVAGFDLSGAEQWRLPIDAHQIVAGASGRLVALRRPDGATLLDSATGRKLGDADIPEDKQSIAIGLTADGSLLTIMDSGGNLSVTDVIGGGRIATISGQAAAGTTLTHAPEGGRLVTGNKDGAITFWDLAALLPCRLTQRDGHAVALSPDGARAAAGDDSGGVTITETRTCKAEHRLDVLVDAAWVQSLAFTPDGRALAVAGGGQVVLLDARTGEEHWRRSVPAGHFASALDWADDGEVLMVGYRSDKVARNRGGWQTLRRDDARVLASGDEHHGAVAQVSFNPLASYVTTVGRGGLNLWLRATGKRRHRIHGSSLRSTAFNPGRNLFVVGDASGRIKVLRHTRSDLMSVKAHRAAVVAVAIDDAGSLIASAAEDGTVGIRDAHSGQLVAELVGHGGTIRDFRFVPGRDLLASISSDGSVALWRTTDGSLVARHAMAAGPRPRLDIDLAGRWIAAATAGGAAQLWPTPQQTVPTAQVADDIADLTPWGLTTQKELPHGKWQTLAVQSLIEQSAQSGGTGNDGPVALETRRQMEAGRLAAVRGDALAAHDAWSPLRGGLPRSYDTARRFNDLALEGLANVLEAHSDRVEMLRFFPDGATLAASDWSGRIILWDTADWSARLVLGDDLNTDFEVSPDGTRLCTGVLQGGSAVFDTATGDELLRLPHGGHACEWSSDGTRLALSERHGPPVIADARDGAVINLFADTSHASRAYAVSPDFRRLARPCAGSCTDAVEIIDLSTREVAETIPGAPRSGAPKSLSFAEDGQHIGIVWENGSGGIHDAQTGAPVFAWPGGIDEIVIAPDGSEAAADLDDGRVEIVDLPSGKVRYSITGQAGSREPFLPGGKLIYTSDGTANSVDLFDRQTGAPVGSYYNHATAWTIMAASPDGRWHATTSGDGRIRIWDAAARPGTRPGAMLQFDMAAPPMLAEDPATGKSVKAAFGEGARLSLGGGLAPLSLQGHRGDVTAAAFSQDGTRLVTGGDDGRVLLWAAHDGALVRAIPEVCDDVADLTFLDDGQTIAAACEDRTIRLVSASTGKPLLRMPASLRVRGATKP